MILKLIRRNFSSASSAFPQLPAGQKLQRFYHKVDVIRHSDQSIAKLPENEIMSLNNLSQVRENEDYWAVTLDDQIINTMFKDALFLPSRALALALAEEWEAQPEFLDVKKLNLNSMVSKGIRSMHDL